MRLVSLHLVLAILAAPAVAEPAEDGPLIPDSELLGDLADTLRDALDGLAAELRPWGERLGAVLSNPEDYEPPEVLPNGDILIRRRRDAPEPDAAPAPERGLDL